MKFNNRNIQIGNNVTLGKNVKIGDNSIIYDNVALGNNVIISNDCVIGEPLNDYYRNEEYENPITEIGSDSLIRSHSIIYADTVIQNNFITGHRVTIREKTVIGSNCMVGSYNDIQGYCEIGDYNRFHSYVNIGQKTKTGDFVFIYPFVVFTNDPTPPSDELIGVSIGDYSQIATGSILLPGAVIGKNCLIAANSTVGGNFSDDKFISGNPAKEIGQLSKMPFFNNKGKRHYPWQYNFDRNMPWEHIGFENWRKNND